MPDAPAVRQIGEAHAVAGDLPVSGLTGRRGRAGHVHHGRFRLGGRRLVPAGQQHAFPGAFGTGLEEQHGAAFRGQPGQIGGTGDGREDLGLKAGPESGGQRTEHVQRGGCGLFASGGTEDETGRPAPERGQAQSFLEEQAAGGAAVGVPVAGKGPEFESRRRSARFGSLHHRIPGIPPPAGRGPGGGPVCTARCPGEPRPCYHNVKANFRPSWASCPVRAARAPFPLALVRLLGYGEPLKTISAGSLPGTFTVRHL